ncbi:hypothetical protein JCM5296_004168, partial [Sporobolomyces johnsonii]
MKKEYTQKKATPSPPAGSLAFSAPSPRSIAKLPRLAIDAGADPSCSPFALSISTSPSSSSDFDPVRTDDSVCLTVPNVAQAVQRLEEDEPFETSGELPATFEPGRYEKLIDSSEVELSDWINLAQDIERNYHLFDGFVILHGTDTMA